MKAGLILSGNGALVYLTSHSKFMDENIIKKFESKGMEHFLVCPLPLNHILV